VRLIAHLPEAKGGRRVSSLAYGQASDLQKVAPDVAPKEIFEKAAPPVAQGGPLPSCGAPPTTSSQRQVGSLPESRHFYRFAPRRAGEPCRRTWHELHRHSGCGYCRGKVETRTTLRRPTIERARTKSKN